VGRRHRGNCADLRLFRAGRRVGRRPRNDCCGAWRTFLDNLQRNSYSQQTEEKSRNGPLKKCGHDSNTSLLYFLLLFTAHSNQVLAGQQFFCIDHIVETARAETAFQSVVPHFKPSALAANRTAASTRMQSFLNRGFHIPGVFRSSEFVIAIATRVARLWRLSLPKRVFYRLINRADTPRIQGFAQVDTCRSSWHPPVGQMPPESLFLH
jgi:hypothetical protein